VVTGRDVDPLLLSVPDEVHRWRCEVAGCTHPAVHEAICVQGWCARCRAVAFGGVYDGVAYVGGEIIKFPPETLDT
jgi:hypothetical protein